MMLLLLSLQAEAGDFGLGLAGGYPSGVTMKWFRGDRAIDLLVGQTWYGGGWSSSGLMVSLDYLWPLGTLASGSDATLDAYIGAGGNLWFNNYGYGNGYSYSYGTGFIAVEMPVGLSVMLRPAPFEFFVELAPMANVIGGFHVWVGGSLGARYYF